MIQLSLHGASGAVAKDGYKDAFLSFTIPYTIGAVIYYIEVFRSVHRQNQLLQDIIKIKDNKTKQGK